MRLHIIGVSEKLTSIEIITATLAVMPNSNSSRPVTLDRNDTGRNTITSEMRGGEHGQADFARAFDGRLAWAAGPFLRSRGTRFRAR